MKDMSRGGKYKPKSYTVVSDDWHKIKEAEYYICRFLRLIPGGAYYQRKRREQTIAGYSLWFVIWAPTHVHFDGWLREFTRHVEF
jgi:ATP-dependent DNA ligase